MSLNSMSNFTKQKSSLCPTNGRQTVGDGAFSFDAEPSVLAVCHLEGTDDMYYYSTTFSGGPGVSIYSLQPNSQLHLTLHSGAFDAPKAKCPPDRGSSDCVTGSPASIYSTSSSRSSSSPEPSYFSDSIVYPAAQHSDRTQFQQSLSSPRDIPGRIETSHNISTPPLTPDDDSDDEGGSPVTSKQEKDALDFLLALFPKHGLSALPFAKSVNISAPDMGAAFDGVVLELPGQPKTLFVDGKSAESVSLRESIVALLDLADENLQCSALVIILERSSTALGNILHSLMYVGGAVVTKPPFPVDPNFVLVGMEI